MFRISMMKEEPKKVKQTLGTKYVVSEPVAIDGAELIPVNLGGRLMPVPVPINELGKQLLKAAGEGNKDEIKKLMSQGAPFTADWLGTSPLHIAAQNNHLDICEILLRAGISRDARTKVDRTPLHMAAYEGHLEIVETLLKHGADYDCKDLLQMTPLHWAAQNGHSEVARTLIKYGAATELRNKFDLTPTDIAAQINRHDIVDIIRVAIRDPQVATHHLALQLATDSSNDDSEAERILPDDPSSPMPVDTVLLEDDSETSNLDTERGQTADLTIIEESPDNQDSSLSESFKLLEQHGITLLQNDETSILSSVMESGRSVVLTDVGKEILDSVKVETTAVPSPPKTAKPVERRKIITVTPKEFLSLASNGSFNRSSNILQHMNGKVVQNVKPTVKRIVMKKTKMEPVSVTPNVTKGQKLDNPVTDMETVMKQLIEARKLVEEYKEKLKKKEAEAEHYKQQLRRLLGTK